MDQREAGRHRLVGPTLVSGFGTSLAVWCAAFVTHMPWLDLSPRVAGPLVLGVWIAATIAAGRWTASHRPVLVGAASGLLAALLALLILGSILVEQPTGGAPAPGVSGLRPSAAAFVPAFLALGALIGLIGGVVGSRLGPGRTAAGSPDWLFRFAVVTTVSFVPLLLAGGAVTSTESGMAIRGWPNSDGANMFLYPISLMADPQKFLEHTHRLFGTLVGLHTIALLLLTFAGDRRPGVRAASVALFVLVTVQGILGGYRVIENQQAARLVHGISAQVILAFALAIAAWLSPAYKCGAPPAPHAAANRLRVATTLFLVALFIQLSLGATYRHLNLVHPAFVGALHSHAAFAAIVIVLALMVGFKTAAVGRETGSAILRKSGRAISHTTGLQTVLGILAFVAVLMSPTRGADPGAPPPPIPAGEALVTTAHQLIGAVLIGGGTLAWVWVRRLTRPA